MGIGDSGGLPLSVGGGSGVGGLVSRSMAGSFFGRPRGFLGRCGLGEGDFVGGIASGWKAGWLSSVELLSFLLCSSIASCSFASSGASGASLACRRFGLALVGWDAAAFCCFDLFSFLARVSGRLEKSVGTTMSSAARVDLERLGRGWYCSGGRSSLESRRARLTGEDAGALELGGISSPKTIFGDVITEIARFRDIDVAGGEPDEGSEGRDDEVVEDSRRLR